MDGVAKLEDERDKELEEWDTWNLSLEGNLVKLTERAKNGFRDDRILRKLRTAKTKQTNTGSKQTLTKAKLPRRRLR